jgi:hypothetical protein
VYHTPHPTADSLQEAQILLGEEVWLCGLRRKRPAPCTVYVERDDHLRADTEALFHTYQLARVILYTAIQVRFATLKNLHGPTTVCDRLTIQADGALVSAHWRPARPDCHEGVSLGFMQECIHLVSSEHLRDKRGNFIHGHFEIGRLYIE